MLKRILLTCSVLMLLGAGCGLFGGGEDTLEFEVIEFEESEPTPTPPVEAVVDSVGLDPATLLKLKYLYGHQVRLGTLRRVGRDLQGLLEYDDESDIGLDWVIEVHAVSQESDYLHERVKESGIPESQRDQYEYLFVGLLEVMDVVSFGSLRLLEAATVIGPDGRSLDTLDAGKREKFLTLLKEAGYFLGEGEEMVKEESLQVSSAIGRVGLR